MRFRLLFLLVIIICTSLTTSKALDTKEPSSLYSLNKVSDDEYYLVLYDIEGEKYDEVFSPIEPVVKLLDNGLIEITISVGSPAHYTIFADSINKRVSKSFFNYLAFLNDKIAYFENDNLVISNIFNDQLNSKIIKRDFSETATCPVGKVEFINENSIYVEYFESSDLNLKSETIVLTD